MNSAVLQAELHSIYTVYRFLDQQKKALVPEVQDILRKGRSHTTDRLIPDSQSTQDGIEFDGGTPV